MPKPRLPSSKWTKYKLLSAHKSLESILPAMRLYSKQALSEMLAKYKTVFVKPDNSFGGKDVMSLTETKRGLLLQRGRQKNRLGDVAAFDRYLRSIRGGRQFLIQQGIALRPWKGRKVDIRTVVQKNEKGLWEMTGSFARAALPGSVLTNIKAGGKILPVRTYLRDTGMGLNERAALLRELQLLSEDVAKAFGSNYSNRRYGLDIGLDERNNFWLLEVNTRVSVKVLRKVDRAMYRRARQLDS